MFCLSQICGGQGGDLKKNRDFSRLQGLVLVSKKTSRVSKVNRGGLLQTVSL